jgi:hypothetical protein
MKISEWLETADRQTIMNVKSRGLRMSIEDFLDTLNHMGEVMSLRKLHRKVAVTRVILDMEVGQTLELGEIVKLANRYCARHCPVSPQSAGMVLQKCMRWRLCSRINLPNRSIGYRRLHVSSEEE